MAIGDLIGKISGLDVWGLIAGKKGKIVGLDIGSHAVKLMQISDKGGRATVEKYREIPLEKGVLAEGAIADLGKLVEAIKRLVKEARCQGMGVAMSLSGQSVIIKKAPFRDMDEHELREAILEEANKYFPFDNMDEVNFDFQVLGQNIHNPNLLDVVIVAAKKEFVESYVEAVTLAGLKPLILDVDSFALETMYERNYEYDEQDLVVLINIGASITNINVVKNATSVFTRDFSLGGNYVTEAIEAQYGLSFEEAEKLKLYGPEDTCQSNDFKHEILSYADPIVLEIERSIDYFRSTYEGNEDIKEVILSGGGALLSGFPEELSDRLRIPVSLANPFRNVVLNRKLSEAEDLKHMAPRLAVVTGLALRRVGDK
ncbi:MAG: pilus assembly protein PilM [Syntrophales bacterium]|nr:pilus assembly protein PilM [Syntrophales bacterium]